MQNESQQVINLTIQSRAGRGSEGVMQRLTHSGGARLRSVVISIGLIGSAVGVATLTTGSPAAVAQDASGADLYATHCAGCHQPGGEGITGTFPPLADNPAAADADYVATVIVEGKTGPIEVLGVQYDAAMPAVAGLSDDQVAALAAHVVELAGGDAEPAASPPPVEAPAVGDIDRGHDLFIGSNRLDEGGGACASCHAAGKVGDLGGQMLGPDLTDAYDRLGGEAGLTAWLGNPASPTMRPIFENDPMTDAEIADLVAFLADAPSQERPSNSVDWLLLAGLAGLVVLLGGMAVAWRGMRHTYVSTLRSRR
jgi:mono/diheme cytochrome c family protein